MHAIQTSGNCIRNVTADPYRRRRRRRARRPAGLGRDLAPVVDAASRNSRFLPRKFKIAVTGAPQGPRRHPRRTTSACSSCANASGELGFEVMVGGGLGRTPYRRPTIREFLPTAAPARLPEAILRVYNRHGRRDNIYKARIKILVAGLGAEEFARQVEEEWAKTDQSGSTCPTPSSPASAAASRRGSTPCRPGPRRCRKSAASTRECRSASSSNTSAACTGWTPARAGAAARWLERLGLKDRASAKVEELSHGNQQRAQLAAALLHEPELLVLDEPFAGLDPVAVHTLAEVLRGEAARGAAVLFSSHQLELVEDICEEVAIIDHGHIVATGDLDALRRSSQQRRIELELDGAPPQWLPDVAGVELVGRRNGDLQLLAGRDVDPEQVLAAAEQTARVVEFSYGPPSLAELFLELVER